MENLIDLVAEFEKIYPDLMVLDRMDEFERVKLIGKVELLKEMRSKIEGK